MRGKEFLAFGYLVAARITPAYAGKSKMQKVTNRTTQDHPRLCGEKLVKHGKKIINLGSPPPMRGKDVDRF